MKTGKRKAIEHDNIDRSLLESIFTSVTVCTVFISCRNRTFPRGLVELIWGSGVGGVVVYRELHIPTTFENFFFE